VAEKAGEEVRVKKQGICDACRDEAHEECDGIADDGETAGAR
jgi:hypothetical protein